LYSNVVRIKHKPKLLEGDGKGTYTYEKKHITRFLDFDFAFSTHCICNCQATGGNFTENNEARRNLRSTNAKIISDRPTVTSVAQAVDRLKGRPADLVRFFSALLEDLGNDMNIVCDCCNDWIVAGGSEVTTEDN